MMSLRKGAFLTSIMLIAVTFTLNTAAQEGGSDLFTVINERDDLSIFAEIVKTAQMETPLQSEGPYTIFAVTNSAFESLDQTTVNQWTSEAIAAQEFIGNHMVLNKYNKEQIENETQVEAINGMGITISAGGGYLMVGGAELVESDIETSNGVLHVLNSNIGSGRGMKFQQEESQDNSE